MSLTAGSRLAKLNRDVAIKVLPAEFAGDSERVARFKREAQGAEYRDRAGAWPGFGDRSSPSRRTIVLEHAEIPASRGLSQQGGQGRSTQRRAVPLAPSQAHRTEPRDRTIVAGDENGLPAFGFRDDRGKACFQVLNRDPFHDLIIGPFIPQ